MMKPGMLRSLVLLADAAGQFPRFVIAQDDAIAGIRSKHVMLRYGNSREPGLLSSRRPSRLANASGIKDLDMIAQAKVNDSVIGDRAAAGWFGCGNLHSALPGATECREIVSGTNVERVVRTCGDSPGISMRRVPVV